MASRCRICNFRIFIFSFLTLVLMLNIILTSGYSVRIPHTREWLENNSFEVPIEPWYSTVEGDSSDVNTEVNLGKADIQILGDSGSFSDVFGTPNEQNWSNMTNPAFPSLPDNFGIDNYGCWANHTWIDPDDPIQAPSIHWQRNITMPVNMFDYKITSASLSAIYNASVTTSPGGAGTPNDYYGVDTPEDTVAQPGDYDTVRFYVLISDFEDNEIYEVAWYQSVDLGQDDPEISNITDSLMNTVVEEALIFYLTSLFERDNFHFKITLGIRIKCVDNFNYDRDRWDSLRIKSCNFSFTYEKIINQFTKVSWNQEGDAIEGENIQITGGNLKFKYKLSELWPFELSPNSEIRLLINNNSHFETIKLNLASLNLTQAKEEGFNVTSLIQTNISIMFSIQIYLADEFLFDHEISIALDDIFLEISYVEIRSDIVNEPPFFRALLIIALTAAAAIGTYFVLYQRILKYPIPIRKVRKYRRTLDSINDPKTKILDRGSIVDKIYQKELSKSSKYLKPKSTEATSESIQAKSKLEKASNLPNVKSEGGIE